MVKPETFAVIGSGYGDEGKGLVTDALSVAESGTCVVRFNGGAQAAHTVCYPSEGPGGHSGARHVFHSLGSGTLRGARTHLSKFFVVNPILYLKELRAVPFKNPIVTVDPRCMVTVPLDMMINQAVEKSRGDLRHGTCGIGFGETIERTEKDFVLRVGDLDYSFEDTLNHIAKHWAPRRCKSLGIDFESLPYHPDIDHEFIKDCHRLMDCIEMQEDHQLADHADRVVFEGAQGLGLDMDLGKFPHVTRSRTGLPNVIELMEEAGLDTVEAIYVTRSYATRHGAGPLEMEHKFFGFWPVDVTNQPNYWQGALRFAPLHTPSKKRLIEADMMRSLVPDIDVVPSLFMTWTDFIERLDMTICLPRPDYPNAVANEVGLPCTGRSWGTTRDHVMGMK